MPHRCGLWIAELRKVPISDAAQGTKLCGLKLQAVDQDHRDAQRQNHVMRIQMEEFWTGDYRFEMS